MRPFSPVRGVLSRAKSAIQNKQRFRGNFAAYVVAARQTQSAVPAWSDRFPCLTDATSSTNFDAHYIYHPAWAARVLAQTRPEKHIDISSTLHFCSLVSAWIPIDFYDFRPAPLTLTNLQSRSADLNNLPFESKSVASISCMHVVEHIGLGRYGDPIDALGDEKAMRELQRVVAPGGSLLFVTPVGQPAICFNAHRIYDPHAIVAAFDELTLREFALVPDDYLGQGFLQPATFEQALAQTYGCGCFWFVRP